MLPAFGQAAESIGRVQVLVVVGGGFEQTGRGIQEALQKSGLIWCCP
jgi:hypothetical protein